MWHSYINLGDRSEKYLLLFLFFLYVTPIFIYIGNSGKFSELLRYQWIRWLAGPASGGVNELSPFTPLALAISNRRLV